MKINKISFCLLKAELQVYNRTDHTTRLYLTNNKDRGLKIEMTENELYRQAHSENIC